MSDEKPVAVLIGSTAAIICLVLMALTFGLSVVVLARWVLC